MSAKRTVFNHSWSSDPKYKDWLVEDPNSKYRFKCSKCLCTLDLSNMGKTALNKHITSKKHSSQVINSKSSEANMLSAWVQPSTKKTVSQDQETQGLTTSNSSDASQSSTLQTWTINEDVLKAEILWTLYTITNHNSYNSSKNASYLFKVMFPDSEIAKKFSCAPTKMSYLTIFGLSSYFRDEIMTTMKTVPYYSLSFDESFNRISKMEQMDIALRYWDETKSKVVNRYFDSKFLGHTRSCDLLESFNSATEGLDHKKLIHVSMDGPLVNHKFYRELQSQRSAAGKYEIFIIIILIIHQILNNRLVTAKVLCVF